jgi:hypothetical protein
MTSTRSNEQELRDRIKDAIDGISVRLDGADAWDARRLIGVATGLLIDVIHLHAVLDQEGGTK